MNGEMYIRMFVCAYLHMYVCNENRPRGTCELFELETSYVM